MVVQQKYMGVRMNITAAVVFARKKHRRDRSAIVFLPSSRQKGTQATLIKEMAGGGRRK